MSIADSFAELTLVLCTFLVVVLHFLPLGEMANWVLLSVRWILLWSIVVVGLSASDH